MIKKGLAALLGLSCFFTGAQATPSVKQQKVPAMVVFGDSLSDNGNVNQLLRSLRMDDSTAYLVAPLRNFAFNKMDDYANDYYVPQRVVTAGKAIVRNFLDNEVGPLLAGVVSAVNSIPLLPEAPYWQHHFSNGYVWNEQLANMLDINIYNKDAFDNQAFGGSWAMTYDYQLTTWNLIRHPIASLQNLVSGKLIPPSLGLAVQGYLMNHRMQASKDALHVVFSGGNDYLNMLFFNDNYNQENMKQYIEHALDGVMYSTQKLVNAGARHIVLFGVPNVGNTPRFVHSSDQAILAQAATMHNAGLAQRVDVFKQANPEVKLTFFNLQPLLEEVVNQPSKFGLKNVDTACIDVPLPTMAFTSVAPSHKVFGHNMVLEYAQYLNVADGAGGFKANFHQCHNPNDYAFWDVVHPTAKVHKLLAKKVCEALKENGYKAQCKKSLS